MSELVLGAVAYDPKVVTTWDSFRAWLREQGLPFDYILYSNYERQVEDLVAGRIQLAWNSALAWVRALRLGQSGSVTVQPVMMRDTDCGLSSCGCPLRPTGRNERDAVTEAVPRADHPLKPSTVDKLVLPIQPAD